MTDGNRSKRNRRIRVFISLMIDPLQPGDRIKTERVLQELQARDSRWGIDAHQVGNLIRQREDLKHVGTNTWEKMVSA